MSDHGLRAAAAVPLRVPEASADDRESTFVLAIDLGTGGPKAALLTLGGRVVSHAFEPVSVQLTEDGGAEQSPGEWWDAIVAASRRALADSGTSPEAVVGVGCTSQWSGTVAVDDGGEPIGNAIIWMDSRGARAVRETVRGAAQRPGLFSAQAGALGAAHRRDPQPVGEGPGRSHPFPARGAP